jgi:N-formylglutamate amidohydrolase
VATAIHAGHRIRPDVLGLLAVDEPTRLREEDPFTDRWTAFAPSRVTVGTSRFEYDLNRPRERAVYTSPGEAWGIHVWKTGPSIATVHESLTRYDRFYREVDQLLTALLEQHAAVVVLDLHAYCHRRGGPDADLDDPAANPEINLGTASVDRGAWGGLIERLVRDLRAFDFGGRGLDVRENVVFQGGHFPRWINGRYAGRVCAIAVEVKKIFMDEWSGALDPAVHERLGAAFESTVPGILAELDRR